MSDELKAKLLEIIERIVDDNDRMHQGPFIQDEEWLAQIDQAYKDAGYQPAPPSNVHTLTIYGPGVGEKRVFMTGQEWYERFEEEILSNRLSSDDDLADALEAAKRAAGLK